MLRRTRVVYGGMLLVWALIVVWQFVEHDRVRQSARAALIDRARDISNTLGLVLRSQRRFGGIISKDRIESALGSLIKPGELNAIALLNDAGDVVASAGSPIDLEAFEARAVANAGPRWTEQTVVLANLIDLGTNVTSEPGGQSPTIVVPFNQMFGTNRARPPGPPPGASPPEGPPPGGPPAVAPDQGNAPAPAAVDRPDNPGTTPGASAPRPAGRPWGRGDRDRDRGPRLGRPFWMNETEYRQMIEKQGVHSFVIVMATDAVRARASQDLWLRLIITVLSAVSVVGFALAWGNQARSSELEVRLVRAAELNTRLKEMNLAAAGLAHETRNPLNIIRGLAQMISQQAAVPTEVRDKTRAILDETDRVTAQLNEFINYSRPREVRRSAVDLKAVVAEVVRALGSDLEEKAIRIESAPDLPVIEADEPLLRQALFNLLINAVQAVDRGGAIQIVAERTGASEVRLEVRDNGPGVLPEHRAEVFKPYFTTHPEGTGLGLAVVQQIVLAHGWEVACLPNEPRGAIFRLTHLRLVSNPKTVIPGVSSAS